ncbi:Uncharacterized conserved protein, DUF302 family [Mycobacterium rhizamassiliense]|jgi:hypothetical protein|uniref:Uncharacterized conserved protein, DUF302 family n=1 Tax=Mycobacterium rhizamassiliense TaxID=1841860 RepID=A0A2U3NMJ8_9MYCO|nr:DUF302 domain-containing protein [Mycobacterium rhizamassiliense]SPM32740.1 Uncharacterized conserved protein, DUF302 family [Mycobacterium rhizamassiliense]
MTQSLNGSLETVSHQVARLTIRIDDTFDGFRNRYEQAVPVFQSERFDSLIDRGVDWQTVQEATAENAPHGFIRYWSHDFSSLMSLAGDGGRCVEYLMGNHTVAEKMYRYDPAILLYAPLRTAIVEYAGGATWFTVDQPSTRFGSFDTPEIAAVGIELDRKLAALLEHLGAPVPAALIES